jgi:hypothetical protein
MAKTMKLSLAAPVALLLLSSAASAEMACGSAEEGLVLGEVVTVDGSEGAFRLICREGRLTAIRVGAEDTAHGIDRGGPPVAIEGTAPAAETGDAAPADTSDPHDTGLYAAGVSGQAPAATVAQSAAEAPASPATLPPVAQPGDEAANKPGVSAEAAAAGQPGEAKSEERIAPEAAAEPTPSAASPEMVRVPAAIADAARDVLPGITFKNVVLSRDGATTVYGLAGENQAGRGVAVDVDQAATVLRVDRQVGLGELPPEILTLAKAVVPQATIDKAVMSIRPNFQSFFVVSGRTAKAEDFALEIRADGRSLAFIEPR